MILIILVIYNAEIQQPMKDKSLQHIAFVISTVKQRHNTVLAPLSLSRC